MISLSKQRRDNDDLLVIDFLKTSRPLVESKHRLGCLNYFLFSTDHYSGPAHGRHTSRKKALIKCISETFERQLMHDFFQDSSFPRGTRNSNGWAAHSDLDMALFAAQNELLERHLLLKSFFHFGWDGFCLKYRFKLEDVEFFLATSRFNTMSRVSGIVIAKSRSQIGVSFGYCGGLVNETNEINFWLPAIYEAADKIFVLGTKKMELPANPSWIEKGIFKYLNNPFNVRLNDHQSFRTEDLKYSIKIFSAKVRFALSADLWVVRATAINALPLFDITLLSEVQPFLQNTFELNGIDSKFLPEEQPIL